MAPTNRHPYSRAFFLLLMVYIGYLSYILVRPYFSVIIFAFIVAIFFRPLFVHLVKITKKRRKLSLLLTWISILLVVLVPIILVGNLLFSQVLSMSNDIEGLNLAQHYTLDPVVVQINDFLSRIPGVTTRLSVSTLETEIQQLAQYAGNYVLNKSVDLGSAGLGILAQVVIFAILLTTFLLGLDDFIDFLKKLSPLEKRLDDLYFKRVIAMTRAMVKGTFVIALAQGLTAGLLFYLVGIKYALFWTVLMFFASIIPLGAGIVTLPAGAWLILTGNWTSGLILILGTLLFVNNLDNFLRPMLVPKEASLHPALLLLGVLGGIHLFGLWGVIYGPVIMILLTTTVEIYLEQY